MPSHMKISQSLRDTLDLTPEQLAEWDEEELRKGYRKNKNGQWTGRPPAIIPRILHDELVRRINSDANELLHDNLYKAVETMVELLSDDDATIRFKTARWIYERIQGRAPLVVEVGVAAKWEEALSASVVSMAHLEEGVIDVESDETEDPDYDPFL